jgi:DNA ligase (NAD+)
MCQKLSEGGRRCATHTKQPALAALNNAVYPPGPDKDGNNAVTEYASTRTGLQHLRELAAEGGEKGDYLTVVVRRANGGRQPPPSLPAVLVSGDDGAAEHRALIERATAAAVAYYDGDGTTVTMTDTEYDALMERIETLTAQHPEWDTAGLTTTVAGGQSAGGDIQHPTPMLSLDKTKTITNLTVWVNNNSTVNGWVVEPKLDGLAVRAEYHEGELVLVASRGNGYAGENLTDRAANITGLPVTIPGLTGVIHVRGEIFMSDADFEEANVNRVNAGHTPFLNPRNATAGALRNTNQKYVTPMTFAMYDAEGGPFVTDTHIEKMNTATQLGFTTAAALTATSTPLFTAKNVVSVVNNLETARPQLGFPIDGAVIKMNTITDRAAAGKTSRAPKWATAYKYAPDTVTTVVEGVELAVGRTVTYASGHNVIWMEKQNLGVGSEVVLYRAGDVIPRAVASPTAVTQPAGWKPPKVCPQCGEPWDTSSSLWRCRTQTCSAVDRLVYACSRDAWDVEGISDAIANGMVASGAVTTLTDLFSLTETQISQVPLGSGRVIGPVVGKKLHANIQNAKNQPVARQITALGLRGTGRSLSRRLAERFGTLSALTSASVAELETVPGIGVEKAALIHEELSSNKTTVEGLINVGVTNSDPKPVTAGSGAGNEGNSPSSGMPTGFLTGLTVVVSGTMSGAFGGLSRNEMNELIEKHGGKATSSVTPKTSYLIAGDGAGSKTSKAESLNVPILTPESLAEKLGLSTI